MMLAILKLFIKYENLGENKFAHGTGWLIRPDVMVTAGHNVYSWKQNAGRAREILAYAGYNGRGSIDSATVETRRAKKVVTTSQWLSNRGSMAHDFALVQFDKPFEGVMPFEYIETPAQGDLELGVVGYPADLVDGETGERGAHMYELFEKTKYDLTEQKDTMLQHAIDCEGGNSGGPLLRGSDLCALATHVYGGDINTAAVLGRYGNPVQDYMAALELPLPDAGRINLLPIASSVISQSDAATGPQERLISQLGDNVVQPSTVADTRSKQDKPSTINTPPKISSTQFDGAQEIVYNTIEVTETLGPVFSKVLDSIITPFIVQTVCHQSKLPADVILRRGLIANGTLGAAISGGRPPGPRNTLSS